MDHIQSLGALGWKSLTFVLVMALAPVSIIAGALKLVGSPKAAALGLIVSALVVPVFALLLAQLFFVKAKWSGRALTVGGGLYSQTLPANQLRLADARIVQPTDPALTIQNRTNGIGMPGLSLGWFTRRSERPVFLAVTDWQRVIVIPTELGYDVLFSPNDPEAFLAAMGKGAVEGNSLW
jgi:hypothetical protein